MIQLVILRKIVAGYLVDNHVWEDVVFKDIDIVYPNTIPCHLRFTFFVSRLLL